MLSWLWLIPLLPLAGFVVNGLVGRFLGKRVVSAIACGTVLLAFLISIGAIWQLNDPGALESLAASGTEGIEVSLEEKRFEVNLWEWLQAGQASDSAGHAFALNVAWAKVM